MTNTINPSTVATRDCIGAKLICGYKDQQRIEALKMVDKALALCAFSLDIKLPVNRRSVLTEDIFDSCEFDSVQDVILALKMIRQGHPDLQTFGKINMEIIARAMAIQREEVAIEKEKRRLTEKEQTKGEKEFNDNYWVRMAEHKRKKALEKMKEVTKRASKVINDEIEKKKDNVDTDKGMVL